MNDSDSSCRKGLDPMFQILAKLIGEIILTYPGIRTGQGQISALEEGNNLEVGTIPGRQPSACPGTQPERSVPRLLHNKHLSTSTPSETRAFPPLQLNHTLK